MSEEIVKPILERIKGNVDSLTEEQAKAILNDLTEAIIVLFVSAEPKLADPTIEVDKKVMPFLKSIAKMAGEGMEAYLLQKWQPEKMKAFEEKISKFKNLETALTLLTK